CILFFFSSRRRHTRFSRDWSSDVCSSDLVYGPTEARAHNTQKLSDFEFVFNLSLDEETTQLELRGPQQSIDLGVRSHHYLMLQRSEERRVGKEYKDG